jgi:translation initiation factor IF-3
LNERIRISPIRVIDQNNNQLGVMPTQEALDMAREAGLDLVEVSPTESPPVCRIINYGKAQFEKKKRQKVSAGSHTVTLKEIRLRPKTDAHDRMIKMKRTRQFLDQGHKVQFTMLFRGRERAHREIGFDTFEGILEELGETVKVERRPSVDGRRMTMVVAPVKRPSGKSAAKAKVDAPNEPAPKPAAVPAPATRPVPAMSQTPAPQQTGDADA